MDDYLRLEIIEYFTSKSKLSKTMVEKDFKRHKHLRGTNRYVSHHRPEISKDIDLLATEGVIAAAGTDPGQGKVHSRGRPQKYYKITEYGLKRLIADPRISKTQFWKVLHDYCSNPDIDITLDKLEEFLLIYINHYARFRNHGFTAYFDVFHALCNNWFMEKVLTSGEISTLQKILEVLAMNPKIAFNGLVEKVADLESNVKEVLSLCSYSLRSFHDVEITDGDYSKGIPEFIIKNIIIVDQEKGGGLTYELSLFGVMLVLLILFNNNMKKLKHGLYIKKYPFKKYCDKIAHNYSHKLPLVFGRWDRLVQILQNSAIYNFDVVLLHDGLVDSKSNSLSVIMKGNEEIFQGIQKILRFNNSLIQDLVNAGYEVFKDYFLVRFDRCALERIKNDLTFKKMNLVCALLEEIMVILDPLSYHYPRLSLVTFTTLYPNRILKYMEESFAKEISAFYYLNLLKPNIDVSEMKMSYESVSKSKDLKCNMEQRLLLLVQEIKGDASLRNWVNRWSEDIDSLYQNIHETVKTWSSSSIFY